jgi:G3E family GTPase
VTVVDAEAPLTHLDDEKPEGVENEAVEQLAFADRIVLNKVDLADDEAELAEVERRIREINALAPIVRTTHGKVDLDRDPRRRRVRPRPGAGRRSRVPRPRRRAPARPVTVTSVGHRSRRRGRRRQAQRPGSARCCASKGVDIFRSKGILSIAGWDERYVFQGSTC